MFGISFTELTVILVVALVVVGPQKLPGMLGTLGKWIRKVREITTEVRQQTGIDEILRSEGLHGGLEELRGILRVDLRRGPYPGPPVTSASAHLDEEPVFDALREYPPEGVDAAGALADDLLPEESADVAAGMQAAPDNQPPPPSSSTGEIEVAR